MTFVVCCVLGLATIQEASTDTPEPFAHAWISAEDATQARQERELIADSMERQELDLPGPQGHESMASNAIAGLTADKPIDSERDESSAQDASVDTGYSGKVFLRQAKSIPWRLGGATAAITLTGVGNWDWGSSSFHFQREGWFGQDTSNMGMDKLGHAYTGFVLTEFFTDGIDRSPADRSYAPYTAGLLAMGLMTYIEVFDGFSEDHGFSAEDMVADAAGVLFSIVRRKVPGLREKVDFRLLYTPDEATFASFKCFPEPHCDRDGTTARSPVTDYSNQRYLFAFKLAGFEPLGRTPLRLLEVHAGYYARGFTAEAEARGDPLRRRVFVGVGINVGELLFSKRRGWAGKAVRSALEYLQVPYTAIHSN